MDAGLWEQLQNLEPDSVCRRSGAVRESDGYRLDVLGAGYAVHPKDRTIEPCGTDGQEQASAALELVVVRYLLGARDLALSGEWVALQELGRFFLSHGPDLAPLQERFTTAPETLLEAARALGGRVLDYGDLAVEVPVLPRVPVAFVYWKADEEFPSRASVLLDRTATQHLSIDVLSALVREAIRRLTAVACQKEGR